jgi:aspartyl protease family protein
MMAAMLQRYAMLSIFLAVLFVAFGSFAGRGAGGEGSLADSGTFSEVASDNDPGPWFRDKGKKRASSIPDRNGGQVQLEREGDSHFYANVAINGRTVRMMVDSGASIIALTRADAEAVGINVEDLPEMGSANTAGGVVPLRPVELDRVGIEGVEVVGVQAAVIDADMPASLLGQSYLSRLQSVRVEGDVMTLR